MRRARSARSSQDFELSGSVGYTPGSIISPVSELYTPMRHRRPSRVLSKHTLRYSLRPGAFGSGAWCRFRIAFALSTLVGTQNSLAANKPRLARKPTPRYGSDIRHRLTPAARMAVISWGRAGIGSAERS